MAQNGRSGEHRREQAALLLAAGRTVKAAARHSGVGERTIARWLQDKAFQARILELRSSMVESAVGRMAGDMAGAAKVPRRLLKSQDERTALQAARSILEIGSNRLLCVSARPVAAVTAPLVLAGNPLH
jgi:hypothetical protein